MEININQLGIRVKETDTIWSVNSIDFNSKTVTYYSFGILVNFSFEDVDFIVCD